MSDSNEMYQNIEQEEIPNQSMKRKKFKKPNFLILNFYQFIILSKRSILSYIFTPFSTLLRLLFPALIILFVFFFRLAILSQSKNKNEVWKTYGKTFDYLKLFKEFDADPEDSRIKFLYMDIECNAVPCVNGEIKSRIISKLNLKYNQVLTLNNTYELYDYLYNKNIIIFGGVVLTTIYPQEKYGINYDVIYNGTKFRETPFSANAELMPFDFSFPIHKALLEALAECTIEYPSNVTLNSINGDLYRFSSFDKATDQTNINQQSTYEHLNSLNNIKSNDIESNNEFRIKNYPQVISLNLGTDTIYHTLLPPCIFLAFFILAIQIHYALNHERQTKSRIALKMMGLKQTPYWFSNLFIQGIFIFLSSIVAIIIGYIFSVNWISKTNPIVMILLFYLTGMALVTNFFLCSTCCGTSRSTNVNGLLLLSIYMSFNILFNPILSLNRKGYSFETLGIILAGFPGSYWMFLFPSYHFFKVSLDISGRTMDIYNSTTSNYESSPGFGFLDLFNNLYSKGLYSFGDVPQSYINLIFLIVIILLNIILIFYFDNIIPQISGGTKLPFYYPFLPSYWGLMKKGSSNLGVDAAVHRHDKFSSVLVDTDEDIYNEYQKVVGALDTDVGEDQDMPIKVVKLSKAYTSLQGLFTGGNKTALDSFTISCNKNEITVLLGHNGGGKSTALNILTGIISPTSGDALFGGLSTINNMDYIRSELGVSMQEDIIFEGLSGYQTMQLFAFIKGLPYRRINQEIKDKLSLVGLWKYRNQKASTYSGGMKRRLSLAIACLGDPKYIILDEICSGVDPAARRLIWNILGKLKQDRCILFSTHDLYEAEMIADKVVILALGRTRGIGTLQHMKNRYGNGFTVQAITDKPEELKEKVLNMLPGSEIESEAHGSIAFSLPQMVSPQLLHFFSFLEEQTSLAKLANDTISKSQILLKDFDLSQTSLEQIFLRLTHGGKQVTQRNVNNNAQNVLTNNQLNIAIEKMNGCIGYIDIFNPSMTMDQVRQKILSEIDGTPKDFEFLSNGVPLSRSQEKSKFALQFSPLVVIRPLVSITKTNQPQESVLFYENERLRIEISQLKSKIDELTKQLEEANKPTIDASDFDEVGIEE